MNGKEHAFTGKVTGDVLSFPGMNDYIPAGESEESYNGRTPYYFDDNITIDEKSYRKDGVNISCFVDNKSEEGYIDFPLFAYKGYVCRDEDGNTYKTGIGEHHRLRVFFNKTEKPVYINITYKVSEIYTLLLIVSYTSLSTLIAFSSGFLCRTKEKLRILTSTGN